MVMRKDAWSGAEDGSSRPDAPLPMMLYGYGSYEVCIDPDFSVARLSYLNRGMIFAYAHIRGGGEMGRAWYEDGAKFLTKKNTFFDFVDCAKYLCDTGFTHAQQLAIEGRSAGGLLMGAVTNMAPQQFRAVLAGVPFVDIMTTMCDPSLPLTVGEWKEWGNPNSAKYYDYMRSYSPVDNVCEQEYPALLILGGLHDPRVSYWEPLKWAAHLREKRTNKEETLLVRIDMAGHFSASDRYKKMREEAVSMAFVLDELKLANAVPKPST